MRMFLSFLGGEFGLGRIYDGKVASGLGKLGCYVVGLILVFIGSAADEDGLMVVGSVVLFGWFVWYVVDLYRYTFLAGRGSKGE